MSWKVSKHCNQLGNVKKWDYDLVFMVIKRGGDLVVVELFSKSCKFVLSSLPNIVS